jgi:PqqD family protein of HPr-rel-A system
MSAARYTAERDLKAVDLDGLTALFHPASGMTHILAPPAPQILDALGEGPAGADEILARMRRHYDLDGGAEAVAARLEELEQVGLVRRS